MLCVGRGQLGHLGGKRVARGVDGPQARLEVAQMQLGAAGYHHLHAQMHGGVGQWSLKNCAMWPLFHKPGRGLCERAVARWQDGEGGY